MNNWGRLFLLQFVFLYKLNNMPRFCILILITLLSGCNNPKVGSPLIFDAFPNAEIVAGENIASNQILNPQELIIVDNYLVVLNNKEDSIFCVFSLHDFGLIETFGKRGHGPNEYIYPHLFLSDQEDSKFYIRDIGKKKIEVVDVIMVVEDQENYIAESIPWKSSEIPLNGVVDYKNIIYDAFTPNTGTIYVTDLNQDKEKAIFNFNDTIEEYKNSSIYKGYLIARENRIAYAYQFFKRIDILNYEGVRLTSSIGSNSNKPIINPEGILDRGNSTIYYIGAYGGKEYIYFLSYGETGNYYGQNINNTISTVEIFSWDGEPIKKITLDRYISHFAIDERRNMIIGVDPRSEQPLFKFNITI